MSECTFINSSCLNKLAFIFIIRMILHQIVDAICTQYQSSLYSYINLSDLLANLPLDFSYYVMTEAIAYRKYSYTHYSYLEDKF